MTKPRSGESAAPASPPCSLAEADDAYAGYLTAGEVADFLNMLLEAERAGAKITAHMARGVSDDPELAAVLKDVSRDEARFCAMLSGHVQRFGAQPSMATGDFQDKVLALESGLERLQLLNRGQGWVARKLKEMLPRIRDDDLHRDLKDMLAVHERNIEICDRFVSKPDAARS